MYLVHSTATTSSCRIFSIILIFFTFNIYEIATKNHHRAVQIHPFQNGNGRWSRMLANIYLKQNGSIPVKWQENLLSKENPKQDKYIKALKDAGNGDYSELIEIHKITY